MLDALSVPVGVRSRRRALPLLTDAERAEAEGVARRLVGELRGLAVLLPESARAASAMSRALSLDRATCQRIVAATRNPSPDAEVLVELPGVLGLRQFLSAATVMLDGDGGQALAATGAAVDRFEQLIDKLGGSQRALRARIAAERAARPGGLVGVRGGADDLAVRAALFRAAADATGRWSDAVVDMHAIRPVAGDPTRTEGFRARAMVGHRAGADAVPLELGQTSPLRAGADGTAGSAPVVLLEDFCTRPEAKILAKGDERHMSYVVDLPSLAPGASPDEGVDFALCDRAPSMDRHPATLNPPVGEVWYLVNFPVRALVFDVLLHREIARRCIPSLEVHLWSPHTAGAQNARWSTRFAGGPRLEVTGSGLERADSRAYARCAEFESSLMARMGWDASEFVGFRCEVPFPLWRSGYCMSFDFRGDDLASR